MKDNNADRRETFLLTVDVKQLDVLMQLVEGMYSGLSNSRSRERLDCEIERRGNDWRPNEDTEFAPHIINVAPVYRQMLKAWLASGAEEGVGTQFRDVFEFVVALRKARSSAVEVSHA